MGAFLTRIFSQYPFIEHHIRMLDNEKVPLN
jgi:hypothetical protein